MDTLWQDLRYATRMLTKNPGFTAVAVLVLAVGIGANTATFTLTNALLLKPIEAEDPHELVSLHFRDLERPDSYRSFSYPNFADVRELNETFDDVMAHDMTIVGLTEGDTTRRVFAEVVSHDYFATFAVEPHRGRFFTEQEELPGSGIPVAVVSHAFWRRHGEDPDLVGETITVNGMDLEVVGIAPPGFTGRTAIMAPELYLPLGLYDRMRDEALDRDDRPLSQRNQHTLMSVGRLRDGLTVEEANARLSSLARRLEEAYPAINEDQTLMVAPLSRISVSTQPQDDSDLALVGVVLVGMTGIVLLLACLNLANMLLARGASRSKELAVRAALGSGRTRILRQLLTEGLLLAVLGGAAGLVVAGWVNRMLAGSVQRMLTLNDLSMDIVLRSGPDLRVLGATAGFCIVGTLLFALGPAWKQSRPDVMEDLKERSGDAASGGRRGLLARGNLLVIGQMALSLVLLVAAGLFIRAALKAADVAPGFDVEHGLLVEIDPGLVGYEEALARDLHRRVHDRLAAIPGIEAVSVASTVPFGSVSTGRAVRRAEDLAGPGGEEIEAFGATSTIIGGEYFDALGVPVLRGRSFTRAETESEAGPRVAIIDRVLAERLWPERDPLGRRIGFGREPSSREADEYEVVGVVETVRDDLFTSGPRPHVYLPFGQHFQSGASIHLRAATSDPDTKAELLGAVRQTIRAIDQRIPVMTLRTLEAHIDASPSLWIVRLGATIFSALGALALFLAVVGVYGVKAYTVARRTREIGIRKALGASSGATLKLVMKESMAVTAVGLGTGLLLAAAVGRSLSSMLYEVSALDPAAFLGGLAVLAAAALVATWVPARRAATVTPIIALRQE